MQAPSFSNNQWIHFANTKGTGKFYFAQNIFLSNIESIQNAFKIRISTFVLKYSIKANYYLGVINAANKQDVHFECASLFEIDFLLSNHILANKITLNTPYITKELVQKCIKENILIQADSIEQISLIAAEAKNQSLNVDIGLRFNFSNIECSRFGIDTSPSQIALLQNILGQNSGLNIKVLHTHFSGRKKDTNTLQKRAIALSNLYQTFFKLYPITTLNIGGGFAGNMPDELAIQLGFKSPGWEAYAESMNPLINTAKEHNLTVNIEPGMALVSDTFFFLCEVISIKKLGKKNIALLNTSILFLKPTSHNTNLVFDVVHTNTIGQLQEFDLVGITCMENDVLGKYTGSLNIGDLIIFKNVGAYTLSFRPNFIFAEPEIVTI